METVGIFPPLDALGRPWTALGLLFVASAQVLHTSYAKVCATHLQLQELGLRQISDGFQMDSVQILCRFKWQNTIGSRSTHSAPCYTMTGCNSAIQGQMEGTHLKRSERTPKLR